MTSKFWEKFSQLPEVRGKSQNQIARELEVAPNTVGAWRRIGVWPDYSTFEKIKKLTGKDQKWFLLEKAEEFVAIPMYSPKLAAGAGAVPIAEEVLGTYQFRRDWYSTLGASTNHSGLFKVQGDSMSPMLEDGDVVLVDMTDRKVRDGKTYAIGEEDNIQIKQLRTGQKGMLRVISFNHEAYPEYKRRQADLRIIGRIRWSARTWE